MRLSSFSNPFSLDSQSGPHTHYGTRSKLITATRIIAITPSIRRGISYHITPIRRGSGFVPHLGLSIASNPPSGPPMNDRAWLVCLLVVIQTKGYRCGRAGIRDSSRLPTPQLDRFPIPVHASSLCAYFFMMILSAAFLGHWPLRRS